MDAPDTQPGLFPHEEYGAEVLCAGWNPSAAAAVEPVGRVCSRLLADLPTVDVDAFLRQFYRCQKS